MQLPSGVVCLLVVLVLALPLPGVSQSSDETIIEELVVTARKREEGLQEVPMAVSALDGELIQDFNIQNVEGLYGRVPGLYFTTVGGASLQSDFQYLQIRGVGFNGGLEPAVGVFVDGMYMPQVGFDLGFLDVERIEVLRGPQGTLFGRNTQAGALNIVTRQRTKEVAGRLEAELAEFGTMRGRAALTGPLRDRVFAGLYLQYATTDGFADGVTTGQEFGSGDEVTTRFNLRFEVTDQLRINLVADMSKRDYLDAAGLVVLDGSEDYEVLADQDTDDSKETLGGQLNIEWDVAENITLTSLTGLRTAESAISYDPDSRPSDRTSVTFGPITQSTSMPTVPIHVAPRPITLSGVTHDTGIDQEFFSQELRAAGVAGQFDWLVGGYYFDQSIRQTRAFDIGPGIPFFPLYIRENFTEDRDGYAVFGQASYSWERFEATFGARYSDENVEKGGQRVLNIFDAVIFAFPTDGETSYDNFSTMASVSYSYSDQGLVYFTYAEGWKAGGINRFPSRDNAILPYDAEESTNLELGLKSTWLDNRLTANLAVFNVDIQGQQVLTVVPDPQGATPVTIIDNAADSTSKGLELELTAQFTQGFSLQFSYSTAKTKFDEFWLNDGAGVPQVDKKGDPFQFVPEKMLSATLGYSAPLATTGLLIEAMLTFSEVDGYPVPDSSLGAPLGAELYNKGYDRWDARATLRGEDWRLTLYVDNLRDSFDYNNISSDLFLPAANELRFVSALEPRQVGLIFSKDF